MADKILVIDDDPNVAELIKVILKPRGLLTYHAIDGQEGLKQAYELQPDLIILDIMMPEHDGFEICARLREFSEVPILMLTAKSQSSDVTRGFAVGADDYVKKPFSNDELVSRIESLIRRKKSNNTNTKITSYSDGVLEIEFATQKISLRGEEVALTPTEFKLLEFLIQHPHKTLSTRTLLTEVWGDAYSHDKALLSLYIHQLRQKLKEGEAEHKYIQTQWGQGYWFNPLEQVQKSTPVTEPVQEVHKEPEEVAKPSVLRWIWILLVVLIILLVWQLVNVSNIFSRSAGQSTSLEAIVTADGFVSNDATGVQGQVCISNPGEYPTENLSVVGTVQASGERQSTFTSTTIDLEQYPVINPNESHCYPYEIVFNPILEEDAKYRNAVSITITNYAGLEIGSQHCPGPDSCAFGPTIIADFSLPKR